MPSPSASAPLIVAGMHRSGTSLVASWMAASGVAMGERLLAPDGANPHGYFEDEEILTLQREVLAAATPPGAGAHPDWGWTGAAVVEPAWSPEVVARARGLIEARRAGGRAWGWKDPRTTLFLELWDDLLAGDARYLLLYREPWEVAESMRASGAAGSLSHLGNARRIWQAYGERLLAFRRRHADRAVLVSVRAALAEPQRFAALVAARLAITLVPSALAGVRDPGLLRQLDGSDPLPPLWLAAFPAAAARLAELEAAADLPSAVAWSAPATRLSPAASPVLSVVVPCHEMDELVLEAVASVERTAPEGCELVVVDDGSTEPDSVAAVEALAGAGYRVVRQPNGGLAAARNRGVRESRGRFLLPLDADNRLLPGFLARAIAVLDADPAVGVVYGDVQLVGLRRERVAVPGFDLDRLLWSNFVDACAVLRREVWEQAGGYDGGAAVWEDWELWIGAAAAGWRFHHLAEPTFEYRVRPGSMLARAEDDDEVFVSSRRHVYRRHADLYRERREEVLLAGQLERNELARETLALRDSRDRLQSDMERTSAAYRGALARLTALEAALTARRGELEARLAAVGDELADAQADRAALREDRDRLAAELDRWRQRVATMEATRAWRLRRLLLRLRGAG